MIFHVFLQCRGWCYHNSLYYEPHDSLRSLTAERVANLLAQLKEKQAYLQASPELIIQDCQDYICGLGLQGLERGMWALGDFQFEVYGVGPRV